MRSFNGIVNDTRIHGKKNLSRNSPLFFFCYSQVSVDRKIVDTAVIIFNAETKRQNRIKTCSISSISNKKSLIDLSKVIEKRKK